MDQNQTQPVSYHPEYQPPISTNAESTDIFEIKEPQIDEELNAHIEHHNPNQPAVPTHLPIQPSTTNNPIPNIPVAQHSSVILDEADIEIGLKSNISNSVHALAIWCVRQLQILRYKEENQ